MRSIRRREETEGIRRVALATTDGPSYRVFSKGWLFQSISKVKAFENEGAI